MLRLEQRSNRGRRETTGSVRRSIEAVTEAWSFDLQAFTPIRRSPTAHSNPLIGGALGGSSCRAAGRSRRPPSACRPSMTVGQTQVRSTTVQIYVVSDECSYSAHRGRGDAEFGEQRDAAATLHRLHLPMRAAYRRRSPSFAARRGSRSRRASRAGAVHPHGLELADASRPEAVRAIAAARRPAPGAACRGATADRPWAPTSPCCGPRPPTSGEGAGLAPEVWRPRTGSGATPRVKACLVALPVTASSVVGPVGHHRGPSKQHTWS